MSDPGTNPGFILAEDAALKYRLTGMSVSDQRSNSRPVDVFFRWPDGVKVITYPFVTVDLLDISLDTETVESYGFIEPEYVPSTAPDARAAQNPALDSSHNLVAARFLPLNVFYQVGVHSRSAAHDRQLLAQMRSMARLPLRYGYLDVPEDNTRRRLDVLEFRQSNALETAAPGGQAKRDFKQYYTVCINAELSPTTFEILRQVDSVSLTVLSQLTEFANQ